MNILVTGGTGFVGSHMLDLLVSLYSKKMNSTIFALRRPNSDMQRVSHLKPNEVTWIDGDLNDPISMENLIRLSRPDQVYHFGALSWVTPSWKMPVSYLQTNGGGTILLLEALVNWAGEHRTRVLVSCTPEEYGNVPQSALPITENTPVAPVNPYAASKVAQDAICQVYQASYPEHLEIIRTRAFNHEGPRRSQNGALASFARQIARIEAGKQEPVIRVGDLTARRNFTHVYDMVEAYRLAMQCGEPGELYLIGSDYVYTIRECLDRLIDRSDLGPSRVQLEIRKDLALLRPTEVPLLIGDCSKFRNLTGWKPTRSFEQILDDILNYWREQVANEVV